MLIVHLSLVPKEYLIATLIIYIIIMAMGYIFNIKWLYLIAGFLWFVPMLEIDNSFITLVSVVMFITHGMLVLFENKNEEF